MAVRDPTKVDPVDRVLDDLEDALGRIESDHPLVALARATHRAVVSVQTVANSLDSRLGRIEGILRTMQVEQVAAKVDGAAVSGRLARDVHAGKRGAAFSTLVREDGTTLPLVCFVKKSPEAHALFTTFKKDAPVWLGGHLEENETSGKAQWVVESIGANPD